VPEAAATPAPHKDARDRVSTRDLVSAGVVEQITADETEADALYVFDSTAKTGGKEAFRRAFFNVGPYAFMLAVTHNSGLALYLGQGPRRHRLPQGRRCDRGRRARRMRE